MFIYCNNNSVNLFDPTGTYFCKISFDAFAPFDCSLVDLIGGGGGGMTGLIAVTSSYTLDSEGIEETNENVYSYTLYETATAGKDSVFWIKVGTFEASGPSFSPEEFSFSVFDFQGAVTTGGVIWRGDSFTLLSLGTVEAGLSAGLEGVEASALVSIWSPEISFDMGLWDLSISGHVGGYGGTFCVCSDRIEIGAAAALGLSVAIEWK